MAAKNSWRNTASVALLVTSSSVSLANAAQSTKNQPREPERTATPSASSAAHNLRVTINSSTAKIIEGAVYGLDAELENVSDVPVSLDVDQIELAVQPELAPPNASCTWLYPGSSNDTIKPPVVLQPGDRLSVFFNAGEAASPETLKKNSECVVGRWGRLRKLVDFVPGNFAFVMTGAYKILPPKKASSAAGTSVSTDAEEHYFLERASFPVTIDQAQMIIFAGLGGLLAFVVMSLRSAETLWEYAGVRVSARGNPMRKLLILLREAGAAILLSSTVTVVAGRLSTTSFPVKVSVDDFWGALTIGFVSYFIGGKFIDKLSQTLNPSPDQPKSGKKEASGAPVTPDTKAVPSAPTEPASLDATATPSAAATRE